MKNKKTLFLFMLALFVADVSHACAQSQSCKNIPLHVEVGFEGGTSCHKVIPVSMVADIGYYVNRFSLHAAAQSDYFMPKEGSTYKYNKASNVGGGLGFVLFPDNGDGLGTMELRALMTTSVGGSSTVGNNSYKVGIYWYGGAKFLKMMPLVSVGYTVKNFHTSSMPTYRGAYVSLGVRF